MSVNPTAGVKAAVNVIYEARKAQVLALAHIYAKKCLEEFLREQQTGAGVIGKYWYNRTANASDTMFSDAYSEDNVVAWFMSHYMFYGVYLEICNDRKYEAIRPLVEKWGTEFILAVKGLYE